jgi:hypothetical protein
MPSSMTKSTPLSIKVRENRLRAMASRQNKLLEKSRRRDKRATDFGRYRLLEVARDLDEHRATMPYTHTLDEIEGLLTELDDILNDEL